MEKEDKLVAFHKAIDEDKGFKSQRNIITYISLVILAINFSGATIKEANTFLFNIVFSHAQGLMVLLSAALAFSLIRYLNYSHKYAMVLSSFWKERFLNDYRIQHFDNETYEVGGLFGGIISSARDHHFQDQEKWGETTSASESYITHINPFKRVYKSEWSIIKKNESSSTYFPVFKYLGFWNFLKVWQIETSYRLNALVYHRESLDIFAPMFLAAFAYLSVILHDKLSSFFMS